MLSTPDGRRLGEALDSLDFMVAIDLYLNETTRHADVILPPTTALERDHYDLVFHSLAIRNTARFSPAVFAKPDGARHDWEIFRDLTAAARARGWTRKAPLEGPDSYAGPRLSLSPTAQLAAPAPGRPAGVAPASCARTPRVSTWGRCARPCPSGCRPRTSGSTWCRRCWSATSTGSGAGSTTGRDDALVLIGRRHKQDNNSWFHNTTRLTRGKPRHQLLMHPDDLAARGIEDGALVTVVVAGRLACGSRWPRPTT